MEDFFNYTRQDLAGHCEKQLGVPSLHADTLYREAFKSFQEQPWSHEKLPKRVQERFPEQFSCESVKAESFKISNYDGSVKFLAKMKDDSLVETVLMPEKGRLTVCVSSQVGCAQACSFCYTGRMGLSRNLEAGEIVGQIMMVNRWLRTHPEWLRNLDYPQGMLCTNIVFMGMGEPLDNVPAVSRALDILSDPYGLNLSLRRISVSTAGHLDGIREILKLQPKVTLALSVHASSERERSQLMPINRRWPISEVLAYLKEQYSGTKKSVLIQYTMIQGVNDSIEHAESLAAMLKDMPVKLNLIPLNEVEPSRFTCPSPEVLEEFKDYMHHAGIRVMVRYSKGQDIGAACGQLVLQ